MPDQKILIISSAGSYARFMMDCLAEAGYETWTVDLGENALLMIQKLLPNLVILDWGLLSSTCLQMIRAIRAQEETARLPMLVLGTDMSEEDVLASLEAGADICLAERLHPKVFVARVHALLRR